MVYEFPSLPLMVIFFGFCRDARTSTYYKRYKKCKKKIQVRKSKSKSKGKKIDKQQNKQKQRNDLPKCFSLKCYDRVRCSKIIMTCDVSWLGTQHTY